MKLLDYLLEKHGIKNDRQLAITLDVQQPVISRIRNGKCTVSPEMILRIHETFNMPVKEIRELCAKPEESPAS